MKEIIKITGLICLVISVLFFSQAVNAQNRIVNIDFETGDISGWNTWAVTDEISSGVNHTPGGSYSASPSLNVEDGPFQMGALIQEFIDIPAGSKIKSSAWIKTDNLRGPSSLVYAILKIEFWEDNEIIADEEAGKLTGTNDWEKATISAIVPKGTDMIKCLLMLWNEDGKGNKGKVYFDDVSLTISH